MAKIRRFGEVMCNCVKKYAFPMSQFNADIVAFLHQYRPRWSNDLTHITETPASNYLIVLREMLIAQDLAMTITDHDATANVVIVNSNAGAVAALADLPRLACAFISITPSDFADSELAHLIENLGGRVVLMGFEAESIGPTQNFDVLRQPFSTDDLRALLNKHRQSA